MPETGMNELAWRFDTVGPHAMSSEICEATLTTPVAKPSVALCPGPCSIERRNAVNGLKRWSKSSILRPERREQEAVHW